MPEWLHRKLAKSARNQGISGKSFKAYVYGTLQRYEKGMSKHHAKKK